ncbi:MAG: hypothetical protein EOM87_04375 [Clostridia bacterium]|nr:hypothetical protein [Clostridia bacterium]
MIINKKIKNLIRYVLIGIVVICAITFFIQQKSISDLRRKNNTLKNNIEAATDTINHYIDENGNLHAERTAYLADIKLLRDYLDLERNKAPITVTKYEIIYKDTIIGNTKIIYKDTINYTAADINVNTHKEFDKSFYDIAVKIPLTICDTTKQITAGNADIMLNQKIWIQSYLYEQDGFYKVNVMTDIPGVEFEGLDGQVAVDKKTERQFRKNWGIGLQLGGGIGVYDRHFIPTVYVGIGIQYVPKFLQF